MAQLPLRQRIQTADRMGSFMNYYEILQISSTSSQEEIKKAYRTLSRKYHPDNAGEQKRELFDQVQEAYDVLGDIEKRQAYDLKLSGGSTGRQEKKESKSTSQKKENNYRDMSAFFSGKYQNSFEQFFGFHPEGKGREQEKAENPVNTDKLFEAFFKVK